MQKTNNCILALEPNSANQVRTINLAGIERKEVVLLESLLKYYRLLFRAKVKIEEDLLIYLPLELCDRPLRLSDRMARARVAIFYGNDTHPRIDIYPVAEGRIYPSGGGFVEIIRQSCPIGISFLPKNTTTPSTYGGIPFDKVYYCNTAL